MPKKEEVKIEIISREEDVLMKVIEEEKMALENSKRGLFLHKIMIDLFNKELHALRMAKKIMK